MRIDQALVLVLLAAIWGASFIFMRVAAPEFGPLPLIGLRVGIAALVLLPVLAMRGALPELRGRWRFLFITGLTNAAIPFSLFAYATTILSAGYTSILNSLAPLFTALIGYFWLKNRLSKPATLGLVLGIIGVVLLVQDAVNLSSSTQWIGVAAGIGAAALYGFAANYAKQYGGDMSALAITGGHLIAAGFAMLPFLIFYWPENNPAPSAWWSAILLAVFCTALAHLLYFWLLDQVSAHSAVSVTFMIPMFGMFWGYLLLDEQITVYMLVGCAIILLGVALSIGLLANKKGQHKAGP